MTAKPWRKKRIIGNCTLYLADAVELVPKLKPADHWLMDPPYEAAMHQAKDHAAARGLRIDGGPEAKPLGFDGIDDLRPELVRLAAENCSGWFLAFCSPEGIGHWADHINESVMRYKRACFWHKPDSAPQFNGQGPAFAVEAFVAAWNGKGHARWNGGGKRNLWSVNTNAPDRDGRHTTEKPWRLMAELLQDFTAKWQTVLDPVMGSGSTLVACQKLGRYGVGIEVDPDSFEIACERVWKARYE